MLTGYILEDDPQLSNIHRRPAVLIFGGGGYHGCSSHEMEPVALAYMAEGYQAFTLRYSCGIEHKFPEPLEDAKTAMRYIRENGETWMVDVTKIAVAGFSAGGHLAAMLANCEKERPAAVVLGYPVILPGTCDVMAYECPDVTEGITAQTPPAFIFSTRDDNTVAVRGSLAYAEELEENGVPFTLHIFPHGSHGLSLAKSHTSMGYPSYVNPDVSAWFAMSVAWLKDIFGDYPSDKMELVPVVEEFDEYSIDVSLENLWACEEARNLMVKEIPVLSDEATLKPAFEYNMSLRNFAIISEGMATKEKLDEINGRLLKIKH